MYSCVRHRRPVQHTNIYFLSVLTCRPPVCVWTQFMHCWFKRLLSWKVLTAAPCKVTPEKQGGFLLKKVHMSCLLNQRGFGKDVALNQTAHKLPGAECCKRGVMRFSGTRPKFVLRLGSVERWHNARQHVRFIDNGGIIGPLVLNACLIPCQISPPNARFVIYDAGSIAESRGWLSEGSASINRCVLLRVRRGACLGKNYGMVSAQIPPLSSANSVSWQGSRKTFAALKQTNQNVTFHDDVALHYNDAVPRRLVPVREHRKDQPCMAAHCFLNYKKG